MVDICINDKPKYKLPEQWNELTAAQLLALAPHLVAHKDAATDKRAYIETNALSLLTGLKINNSDFTLLEIKYKLLPAISFLFNTNQLTKNLFPVVRIRKGFKLIRYHGPADNFNNLTFNEFDDAEFWLEQFYSAPETDKPNALNMLCAILYRPHSGGQATDTRVAYQATENDARALVFASADWQLKLCLLLFYIGCRNSLVADFKMLFDGKGGDSGFTWTDFAHSLAGPVLGNIDNVNTRPVRQVFFEMKRLKQAADALDEERRKNE